MANCVIHPIPLLQTSGDKSRMTYCLNYGQQLICTNYAWYIEGAGEKILIDTGGSIEFFAEQGRLASVIQSLDSGLGKWGISFGDIDLIIPTHLHHDHVAQASRFPNARVLVQREELEFAQNPHPAVAASFNKQFIKGLDFEVISGDTRISEEISVIRTPGHTPGGQSVCIRTAQGVAIIAGLCTIQENFEPSLPVNEAMLVIPPAIHINVLESYDSLLRIKAMADIVIAPHDTKFQHVSSIP